MTRREQCRAAQKRYEQTAKGKATKRRYERGTGLEKARQSGRRRIFVGRAYVGRAASTTQAATIKTHIKERVSAFKGQQSRAKTQGAA